MSSEILLYCIIKLFLNTIFCAEVIFLNLQHTYIKGMEYANIMFIYNKCSNKLIEIEGDDFRYNFCLFQYMTPQNKLAVMHNKIIFKYNLLCRSYLFKLTAYLY